MILQMIDQIQVAFGKKVRDADGPQLSVAAGGFHRAVNFMHVAGRLVNQQQIYIIHIEAAQRAFDGAQRIGVSAASPQLGGDEQILPRNAGLPACDAGLSFVTVALSRVDRAVSRGQSLGHEPFCQPRRRPVCPVAYDWHPDAVVQERSFRFAHPLASGFRPHFNVRAVDAELTEMLIWR